MSLQPMRDCDPLSIGKGHCSCLQVPRALWTESPSSVHGAFHVDIHVLGPDVRLAEQMNDCVLGC